MDEASEEEMIEYYSIKKLLREMINAEINKFYGDNKNEDSEVVQDSCERIL